jgi:predicted helicase
MSFQQILEKYRQNACNQKDKGDKFERLMQRYLQTDPVYFDELKHVRLWDEFP